ncbi:hypothetical protein [Deinococcus altitudinis]|uniref:hypothetical protein n=1 Tax=Deinococcus altitudinis TaxID=468914 RepID=UPI00389248A4
MTAAWTLQTGQEVLGAAGLRPSPAHGAEVLGGAFTGPAQHAAALALLAAALADHPRLYAYAEPHLLPAGSLEAAGLRKVGAYTRMSGPLPSLPVDVPEGFRIVPLSGVASLPDRLAAQQTYSDMIGHTFVPPEFVLPGVGGCDDTLSRLAHDSAGVPAGICRVWLEGGKLSLTTPGVRSDVRHTGLRRALLLSVCEAARSAGAARIELEAWGDTEDDRAEDQALGLEIEAFTPIYASVH